MNIEHVLKCAATGLFLSDATQDFEVVAVTTREGRALRLPDADAGERAARIVRALYPSFDWRPVEVRQEAEKVEIPFCLMPVKRPAIERAA